MTNALGQVSTTTYDAVGRTTGVRNTKASGALIDGGVYYYDPVGNPTHAALAWGSRVTYTYDENDRLVRERRLPGAPYDHTFTYDGAGNRLTKVDSGVTTTYSYDEADRLLTEDAAGALTTYSWDDAGNNVLVEAAAGLTTMTWDCEDRLRTIQVAGGSVVTNTYDADGLRRRREEGADTVLFMWDGQRLLRESDASYVTQALYSAALGDYGPMISQYRASGGTRLLHPNAQGTITNTTNTTGSSVDSYIFDAFGEPISVTGYSVNPHRYIGQQGYFTEPALGLDYVRARWYRPGTGSWLSADPVPSEPQYQYVGSRPTMARDPAGLWGALAYYIWSLTPSGKQWEANGGEVPAVTYRETAVEVARIFAKVGVYEEPWETADEQGRPVTSHRNWGEAYLPGDPHDADHLLPFCIANMSWYFRDVPRQGFGRPPAPGWEGPSWCSMFAWYGLYEAGLFGAKQVRAPGTAKGSIMSYAHCGSFVGPGFRGWKRAQAQVFEGQAAVARRPGEDQFTGDLFILQSRTEGEKEWHSQAHVGFVEWATTRAGEVVLHTIEGNTPKGLVERRELTVRPDGTVEVKGQHDRTERKLEYYVHVDADIPWENVNRTAARLLWLLRQAARYRPGVTWEPSEFAVGRGQAPTVPMDDAWVAFNDVVGCPPGFVEAFLAGFDAAQGRPPTFTQAIAEWYFRYLMPWLPPR